MAQSGVVEGEVYEHASSVVELFWHGSPQRGQVTWWVRNSGKKVSPSPWASLVVNSALNSF